MLIEQSLKLLAKSEDHMKEDLYKVKDFEKIKLPKQDLTISQNRVRNDEIF